MSSTRSELCGIFAALTHLRLIIQFHHLVTPSIGRECVLHCDSQATLKRLATLSFDCFGKNWRFWANYDLEAAIQSCIRAMQITVTWKWVKGHARRRKKPCEFLWAENLNDQADILATNVRNLPGLSDTTHWPEQDISIEGPRGRISGRLDHEIRYCCTAKDLMSYWQQRFQWTPAQVASIDIIATQAASRKIRLDMARRIQKLRCGWLLVNNREAQSDPDRVSGCSACSPSHVVPETVDTSSSVQHRHDDGQSSTDLMVYSRISEA
jgi:ribonuclease HI